MTRTQKLRACGVGHVGGSLETCWKFAAPLTLLGGNRCIGTGASRFRGAAAACIKVSMRNSELQIEVKSAQPHIELVALRRGETRREEEG